MNNVKANIVVMSHLNDAEKLITLKNWVEASKHINFVKYILIRISGNMTKKIDADKLWSEFIQQSPN